MEAADGRLMAGALVDVISEWAPDLAVIEGVHSMPGQGVSTTFKFGRAFGTVEGVMAAMLVPSELISPAVWKRRLGVTRDKASSRALASRLWPANRDLFARVKDDGRAEAALIAWAWLDSRSRP
jgi:crossover junction endodeoxyribonuclease RuvC